MRQTKYSRRQFLHSGGTVVAAGVTAPAVLLARPATSPKRTGKVRIGVVGGGFGSMFQWHEHPDCTVAAVSDLRADRRQKLMDVYGCAKSYESLEKLILDRDIDAVAVFTGAPDHARHCVACLNAGKHVISAVPAAQSIEQCEEILAAVKKTGLTYMMAETSYYYQSAITARNWFRAGKFGELFYTEAEYMHPAPLYPGKGSLQIDKDGKRTWRHGMPPMLYPTHSISLLLGTTGERLVEVTCLGWSNERSRSETNAYNNNPFVNSVSFFKTDQGHALRVAELRYGAIPLTVRAHWFGTKMSLSMAHPGALAPTVVLTSRDRTSNDDAGYGYQEAAIEKYDQPQWWQTELLPAPLRHNRGGHDGSHPFLTHEFISALMEERRPTVDIYAALAYTAPGIIAHQSALRGGAQLKIPRFDP